MNYNKVRDICRYVRIIVGAGLVIAGLITWNPWFFLGALPLVAGTINFCPLCTITKKCDIDSHAK